MKKLLLSLLCLSLLISVALFSACAPKESGDTPKDDPNLQTITGISFSQATYTYDGTEKSVLISGTLPEGVTVAYQNNAQTNAGTYTAKATLSGEGYNTKTLTTTLEIKKATYNMNSAAWNYSSAFTYDGTEKSVAVTGLPTGVTVNKYTNDKKTNAGDYTATVTLNYDTVNYNAPTIANLSWKINKATYNMNSAAWNYSSAFTYDGTEKSVAVTGLPTGVTVNKYTNDKKTNAGDYTATVTLNYDTVNYTAPTIADLSWKINKATMQNITLSSSTVEYDTLEHSIEIVGNTPSGSSVKYTYNDAEQDSATAVGTYIVKAIVTCTNYNDLTLSATLKITAKEEELYSFVCGDTVYFQNNLDSNKLYSYKSGTLEKVSNDIASFITSYNNNLYYVSSSLLKKNIKKYNGTNASVLYSVSADYITTDGTYLYYSVNNTLLNTDQNGIYKRKIDGTDNSPTVLTTDKAEYLVYYDGYIYYSNLSEGKNLYKISTSANNQKGTLIWEEKVEYIIEDNGILYFNSTKTVLGVPTAAAIYKYDTESANDPVKITTDSGKYLTKVGNYIFYVNNDKLTSTIFGDGIYKVSTILSASVLPGTKVISVENNGFSSLTSDGNSLYYYKLNDKHFYEYNLTDEEETDLMANFVVTVSATKSGYVKLAEYNGEIYYTDPLDSGCLYKYNISTKTKIKVIDDSVSGIYFNNGYMYYSTYLLSNYALFRMNLQTNISEKISSDRCDSLFFDNDTIYYVKVGSVYNNYIYKMDLDGQNPVKLFDTTLWISHIEKIGNTIYACANKFAGDEKLYTFDLSNTSSNNYTFESKAFTIDNGIIYYYNHNDNTLNAYNGTSTAIVEKVTVNDLAVINGKLYYSSTNSTNTGIYVYDLTTKQSTKLSNNNGDGFTLIDGEIYFIQTAVSYTSDKPSQSSGNSSNDGCLYKITSTNEIKKVK